MKTFVLRNPDAAHELIAFLKEHAGPNASAGHPLAVEVSEYRVRRSQKQNGRYWKLIQAIAEQVVVNGRRFDADVWHEEMKNRHAPKEESPSGALIPISTARMNIEQFGQYMTAVEVDALSEFNVEFSL